MCYNGILAEVFYSIPFFWLFNNDAVSISETNRRSLRFLTKHWLNVVWPLAFFSGKLPRNEFTCKWPHFGAGTWGLRSSQQRKTWNELHRICANAGSGTSGLHHSRIPWRRTNGPKVKKHSKQLPYLTQ